MPIKAIHDLDYFKRRSIPVPESGCWLWEGILNDDGYAMVGTTLNGKHRGQRGHRLAYQAAKGIIPTDLTIDHLCRVKCCVNPDHMEVVTRQENSRRALIKTHCYNGHEYTSESTYVYVRNGKTNRTCKPCAIARARKNREDQY